MSNPHFTFPPPPPPPPQASSDHNRYPYPPSGQRGPSDRGRGGGRGYGSRGRGYDRGVSRGGHGSGYGGYPPVDPRQTEGRYGPAHNHSSNYPLPTYPDVQQPQYPANIHDAYSHPSQHTSQVQYSNHHQPMYSDYPANDWQPTPNYERQRQDQHYAHGSPPPNFHGPRYNSPQPSAGQPIVMPPIRVGRDGRGGILRTPAAPPRPPNRFKQELPVKPEPQDHNYYQVPPIFENHRFDAPNGYPSSRGRGQRGGRPKNYDKPRNPRPNGQVAPAVPSFGNPLPNIPPVKPPAQATVSDATKRPKKKKRRRHNQLGLTPKTEDHESSSEEEDDQDEEMKLAAAGGVHSIQFEYKGQTSTLQSSSEIAAWIAERKKRFPTQARAAEAAERKKQNEEAQRKARQAAKESQEKRRAEARERQEKQKAEAKQMQNQQQLVPKHKSKKPKQAENPSQQATDKDDAALKARLKIEKLRKRLEKEEKRAAKAEAKASRSNIEGKSSADPSIPDQLAGNRKRKRTDSIESSESIGNILEIAPPSARAEEPFQKAALLTEVDVAAVKQMDSANDTIPTTTRIKQQHPAQDTAQNPLTPTSQPSNPDIEQSIPSYKLPEDGSKAGIALPDLNTIDEHPASDENSNDSLSDTSSDISSDSDSDSDLSSTSSSGSSSSSSDDAPESAPSKQTQPIRVPPPKRVNPKQRERSICRNFLKNGRCPRGKKCHYRHELPEQGSVSKADRQAARGAKNAEGKKEGRKGLYQRLVEKEKEEEDRIVLKAIIELGEKGLLGGDAGADDTEKVANDR